MPARYQEELLASAGALVESIRCDAAPPAAEEDEDEEDAPARSKGKPKKHKGKKR